MPRVARNAPGGLVYHVINRANGRLRLFRKSEDFAAFEKVLGDALERHPTRLLDWCVMSNHWHLVVWPREDGELSDFVRWLTHTHVQRWHAAHGTAGTGHVYQGRFKSFPIQQDEHLETVLRYVQLNPVRAKVVESAFDWPWGSCHARRHGPADRKAMLSDWPIDPPRGWSRWLAEPMSSTQEVQIAASLQRSRPLGDVEWTERTAKRLGLDWTLRPRGRPRKIEKESRPL